MAIKNVMVVDDSPTEQHLLREMLTKNGFNVSVVKVVLSPGFCIIRSTGMVPDIRIV